MSFEIEKPNSLREIIAWLATEKHIQYLDLKRILLPFDYFPNVLIDDLNEKSIALFDEYVLEDKQGLIVVHQELLSELLTHLDEVDSLSSILDMGSIEQSNSFDTKPNLSENSSNTNLIQPATVFSNAGDDIYEEALNYYVPYGKYPQNEKETMRLFKKAARMGCLDAYIDIANIYEDGGVFGANSNFHQSYDKAIEYYILGARRGNIYCHYRMGILYATELKDAINARKGFLVYAQKFSERQTNDIFFISNENINTIATDIIGAIYNTLDIHQGTLQIYFELVIEFSPVVRDVVIKKLEDAMTSTNNRGNVVAALQYFKNYLQENC